MPFVTDGQDGNGLRLEQLGQLLMFFAQNMFSLNLFYLPSGVPGVFLLGEKMLSYCNIV